MPDPQPRFASSPLFVLTAFVSIGILAGKSSAPKSQFLPVGIFIASISLALLSIILVRKSKMQLAGFVLMASFLLAGRPSDECQPNCQHV
jgi:hypothetical protein